MNSPYHPGAAIHIAAGGSRPTRISRTLSGKAGANTWRSQPSIEPEHFVVVERQHDLIAKDGQPVGCLVRGCGVTSDGASSS